MPPMFVGNQKRINPQTFTGDLWKSLANQEKHGNH